MLRQRKYLLISTIVILLILVFLMFYPRQERLPTLPDVKLETLDNTSIELRSFVGQPLVINLWATWCGPCRREMPLFQQMQTTHPNITFVFANQKETKEQVEAFLQEQNLQLENVLLDPTGQLTTQLEVFGLPSTFFFDAKGNLLKAHAGEFSSVDLFNALTDLAKP